MSKKTSKTKKTNWFYTLGVVGIAALIFNAANKAVKNSNTNPDPTGHPNAVLDTSPTSMFKGMWVDAVSNTYYNASTKKWVYRSKNKNEKDGK